MKDKSFLVWICATGMQERTTTNDLKPILKIEKNLIHLKMR